MKRLYTLALMMMSCISLQGQSDWNIGLQAGIITNVSSFKSGDETANALFTAVPYTSGQFNVLMRYRINNRLAFQTGFHFNEIGFSYRIGKDYSLLSTKKNEPDITMSTCISAVPAMILWNSKLNCRNKRWVIGAGFTYSFVDGEWVTESDAVVTDAGSRMAVLQAESKVVKSSGAGFTWMIGIEKVKPKGNSFLFSLNGQCSATSFAESTVNYVASGKSYNHTFENFGSSVALSFTYHFMPFGTKRAYRVTRN